MRKDWSQRKEILKSALPIVLVIVCVIIVLSVLVANYIINFNKALLKENTEYLEEITGQITSNIQISLSDTQKARA